MSLLERKELKNPKPASLMSHLLKMENESGAVISHYLYDINADSAKQFKRDALAGIKQLLTENVYQPNLYETVDDVAQELSLEIGKCPFAKPKNPKFHFIDLFAGIGGFRVAMQKLGGQCVFSSEWDKNAKQTYAANFGEIPFGDITKAEIKKYIPKHFDVLCAGFPCQAFSIAGHRGGFSDTRGTLFFDVAEIIKKHKPTAIFLENVKGLRSHDKGRTLATILSVLRNDLGYFVPDPQIMNAKHFGVPQNRERIYIVGFLNEADAHKFKYPAPLKKNPVFEDVKEESVVSAKYYLSTRYLECLRKHKARHEGKGNGFGYMIINDNEVSNSVVCGGMGRERNLVLDKRIKDFTPQTHIMGTVNREGVRKMTPREWARLQGFPDKFVIPVADASAYKQFGNSVAVPAIQATANMLLQAIGRI